MRVLFFGFTNSIKIAPSCPKKSNPADVRQCQVVAHVADGGDGSVERCQEGEASLTSQGGLCGQRLAGQTHAVQDRDACVHARSVFGDLVMNKNQLVIFPKSPPRILFLRVSPLPASLFLKSPPYIPPQSPLPASLSPQSPPCILFPNSLPCVLFLTVPCLHPFSHSPLPASLSLHHLHQTHRARGCQLKLRYISGHGHYFWLMTRFSTTTQNVDAMHIFGYQICLKKFEVILT